MRRRPVVVFDLDGTLIDGYAAIGDALGYAMTPDGWLDRIADLPAWLAGR